MNIKHNAYHVKLKLIPKEIGYKSSFVQGIVFDENPKKAEEKAVKEFENFLKKEPFDVEVKFHSIVKLRKDFLLYPNTTKDDDN